MGCRNPPQIQGILMHGVQKHDPDSGDIYARGVETNPRFRAYLCTGCRNMNQIQDRPMHGVQKHDPDSGHIYAQGAETCLRFKADLCTVCRESSQFWSSILRFSELLSDTQAGLNDIDYIVAEFLALANEIHIDGTHGVGIFVVVDVGDVLRLELVAEIIDLVLDVEGAVHIEGLLAPQHQTVHLRQRLIGKFHIWWICSYCAGVK